MHTETFDYAGAGQFSGPARSTWLQRVMARVRTIGATYELDPHIARDIGVRYYTVPLFPERFMGAGR
jgi:hypothetical protein